jgi:hypothetical protein
MCAKNREIARKKETKRESVRMQRWKLFTIRLVH